MAGYVENKVTGKWHEFHIGDPDLAQKIRQLNGNSRVMNLQVDCDELDATLYGLENYKKP